jgi:MIP family channel proteins
MNLRAFFAELIGTFLFVLVGVLSAVASAQQGSTTGAIGVALAHGLALAVLVSATAHISGGQLNPAITLAVWLGNQIKLGQAVANIVAQCAGSFLAIHALIYGVGQARLEDAVYGLPMLGTGIDVSHGLFLEGIFTFILALVVFGPMVDRRSPKIIGLYVGLTVTASALSVGAFTGACLNPARYIGPALGGGGWNEMIVYTAGPILGACIGALVYTYGIGREEKLDLPGEE